MTYSYDMVLKGGEVHDPSQDLRAKRDVAFKDGKVAAVAEDISASDAAQTFDVAGKMVTPGLIDMHGHFAHRLLPLGIHPDVGCLPYGVTTALDTGSTGCVNFPAFREYVIERADTRVFALLHISALGIGTLPAVPDLADCRMAREEDTVRRIEENKDVVRGLKVRLGPTGAGEENSMAALEMGRRIVDQTGTRLMVHVYESHVPLARVVDFLHEGDMMTHCFHADTNNILDAEGEVRPEIREAVSRGVVLDTGNAQEHFSMHLARAAMEQGLYPHTLGTDRVIPQRPGRTNFSVLDNMTMYMEMGLPFEEVIRCVTANGAQGLGRDDLGNLRVGSVGDAAVLEFEEGEFAYEDLLGGEVRAPRRFTPVMTIKDGKRWRPH